MKLQHLGRMLLIMSAVFFLQSCGNGGSTDTSGSLSLSALTSTNNTDGTFTVSTSVTYTPPAGKVPNGVVIKIVETDILGDGSVTSFTSEHTLTDSNTIDLGFHVNQSTSSSTTVVINASIGAMSSQRTAVVPALAAVSALPIQFLSADPAGTPHTTTITGGIAPYSLVEVSTAEISATLSGTTLTVINLVAPAIGAAPVATIGTVTVRDSIGNTSPVQVTYFK